jgi:hypothetical protein
MLKNSSTGTHHLQVCTGDPSRAGRFGKTTPRRGRALKPTGVRGRGEAVYSARLHSRSIDNKYRGSPAPRAWWWWKTRQAFLKAKELLLRAENCLPPFSKGWCGGI